jgi:hypothetical protein
MKLRIRGDSLRLRLTQTEVERFRSTGEVHDDIHVGGRALRYSLIRDDALDEVGAIYREGEITVGVPRGIAERWISAEEVGFSACQRGDDGRELHILVEKDFKCLTARPGEDDGDGFPNPNRAHE